MKVNETPTRSIARKIIHNLSVPTSTLTTLVEPNTNVLITLTGPLSSAKNGENKTVDTVIDNRGIISYNPYLLMKYDCHICVDLVTAMAVIAYLYKCTYKKADTIRAGVSYGKYFEV